MPTPNKIILAIIILVISMQPTPLSYTVISQPYVALFVLNDKTI